MYNMHNYKVELMLKEFSKKIKQRKKEMDKNVPGKF